MINFWSALIGAIGTLATFWFLVKGEYLWVVLIVAISVLVAIWFLFKGERDKLQEKVKTLEKELEEAREKKFSKKELESPMKVERCIFTSDKNDAEKLIAEVIKKMKNNSEIIWILNTCTFPEEIWKEIEDVAERTSFKVLIPLDKRSVEGLKKLFKISSRLDVYEYDPGDLRMVSTGDNTLIGIEDPITKDYYGMLIRDKTFSENLRNAFRIYFSPEKVIKKEDIERI